MENMFWFFSAKFTILPVLLVIPVFALLGWLVSYIMYDHSPRQSIVEELRDSQKHCRPLSFWAEDDFQFRYILRIMSLYYVAATDNPKEC